jgi:hypothetical protein
MSLITDIKKLAGVEENSSTVATSKKIVENTSDFSSADMKIVRTAVIHTLKSLEKEARDTQRPSLTKLYKQDADAYDDILKAIMDGHHGKARQLWTKQDTGCRDHVFDGSSDVEVKHILAKYFGTTLLKESSGTLITEEEQFYVVLPASANSEISDIVSKVSSTSLKNIIMGSPKDEIKDIAIFPASAKAKANALAQTRWHDAREAPEDEEVVKESTESEAKAWKQGMKAGRTGGSNPYDKKTNPKEYNEWEDGFDDGKSDRRGGHSKEMTEASKLNHMNERTFETYAGWKKACKKMNPDVWFDGDEDIANAMVGPKPYVRGKTRSIGEWDGAEGSVYNTSAVAESSELWNKEDEMEDSYAKGMRAGAGAANPYKKGTKDHDFWNEGQKDSKDDAERGNVKESVTDYDDKHNSNKSGKTRKELLSDVSRTKASKDVELARKAGATQKEIQSALSEGESDKEYQEYVKATKRPLSYEDWVKKQYDDEAMTDQSRSRARELGVKESTRDFATLEYRVMLKFGDKWKKWEAFASEGKAKTEGKKAVEDTSATDYKVVKESEEQKVIPLDDEQAALEKQGDVKPETDTVPAEVFKDVNEKIKEIKFKIEHLAHIDTTYQTHGYWARFVIELEKVVDMLKQGTSESFKQAATKLQTFENVALVEIPDSLWKFLSIDMHKTPDQRKSTSLSAKFQEVKHGTGE